MTAVCRTCLNEVTPGLPFFDLNVSEVDSYAALIRTKLEACLPELTLEIVKDPVICNDCVDTLCAAYNFKQNCLSTEEKIYNYILEPDSENENIDINLVVQWLSGSKDKEMNEDIDSKQVRDDINLLLTRCDVGKESFKEDLTDEECVADDILDDLIKENVKSEEIDEDCIILSISDDDVEEDSDDQFINSVIESVNTEHDQCQTFNAGTVSANIVKGTEKLESINGNNSIENSATAEERNSSPSMIISGLSCHLDHFSQFEDQYSGYTMYEFYSNGLVDLPECSVVLDRLSEEEINKWTTRSHLYSCDLCEKRFFNEKEKKKHDESYHKDSILKCLYCDYSTPSKKHFLLHRNDHGLPIDINKNYSEVFCEKRQDPVDLNPYNEELYKCGECIFSTNCKHDLQLHMKEHFKEPNNASLKCGYCSFDSESLERMTEHLKLYHHSLKHYTCGTCQYSTTNIDMYRNHTKLYMPHFYRCMECPYSTLYRGVLTNHYHTNHFIKKPFKCPRCHLVINTRQLAIKHVMLHADNKLNVYNEHNYSMLCKGT